MYRCRIPLNFIFKFGTGCEAPCLMCSSQDALSVHLSTGAKKLNACIKLYLAFLFLVKSMDRAEGWWLMFDLNCTKDKEGA